MLRRVSSLFQLLKLLIGNLDVLRLRNPPAPYRALNVMHGGAGKRELMKTFFKNTRFFKNPSEVIGVTSS